MTLRRRDLIARIGLQAGAGVAYAALRMLGLYGAARAATLPPANPDLGRGRHVAIVGAGIAGLAAAIELERRGYTVTVLEARTRTGGRCWTLRGGDRVDLEGAQPQGVTFADGLFMDAGPSRIPSDHERLIAYCREFAVPLVVDVNANRHAYFWAAALNGGVPVRMRQVVNDTRGYLAGLLARVADQDALALPLSADDRARLLPLLRIYGDLGPDDTFHGSDRSGAQDAPLPLPDLLKTPGISAIVYDDERAMQATMLQPAGGMDRIPAALEGALRSPVRKGVVVHAITRQARGARVGFTTAAGAEETLAADAVIVTLPPEMLRRVRHNLGRPVERAIAGFASDWANKIAFEAPRFWEAEDIYGGISFAAEEGMTLAMYPSQGFLAPRGVLIASYTRGAWGGDLAARPIEAQLAAARATVGRLHPGHESQLGAGVVVDWSRVPFSLSPWTSFAPAREGHIDSPPARLLAAHAVPVCFAGAYLSQLPGWQEGAVIAAHEAVAKIVAGAGRP